MLRACGQVTLIRDLDLLWPSALLSTASVLALDIGGDVNGGLALVQLLTERHPALRIILINGRLSQSEIAEAFKRGVCDYFASTARAGLVVERLVSLARRRLARTEPLG